MPFSPEWDRRYRENTHMSIWPWSDVVSLVKRFAPQLGPQGRVLELGCGAGANIPFFEHLGVDYHALEGSPVIVRQLQSRFPVYAAQLHTVDFTAPWPISGKFDLICDRASVTHNTTSAIQATLTQVLSNLKPDAIFIGVDWFSTAMQAYGDGQEAEDIYTRTDYTKGGFTDVGQVHFSDEAHLRNLFADFELLYLEHRIHEQYEPVQAKNLACWNLVARKPR